MSVNRDRWGFTDFAESNVCLTTRTDKTYTLKEKLTIVLKRVKNFLKEITVEPCLFLYMFSITVSSLAVKNIELEKSCRVNYDYADHVCDSIMARDTKDLQYEMDKVQTLVAIVTSWKLALQTVIPAVLVLFVGTWSDRTKKRKIFILFPMTGELVKNIGLILDTYYMQEWSLYTTAFIEALPMAFTGSYIFVFMGMYSYMTDITTVEERTFRLGIVTISVSLSKPLGTALSGILLHSFGYYGVFSLVFFLNLISLIYGVLRLEDVVADTEETSDSAEPQNSCVIKTLCTVWTLVYSTVMIVIKRRTNWGRLEICLILVLYFLMVAPLYGDSNMTYLYVIKKFSFKEVEYSIYSTIDMVLGLLGTLICISVLSKVMKVEDSAIGALAAVSRIAACFLFAFAPDRILFYFAPLANVFSGAGVPAIRSMATKQVPSNEIAQLSSLMSVSEAFAPSIYTPISSFIYAATISNFPGAFYVFEAFLTAFALLLFWLIYTLKTKEQMDFPRDPEKKEEFAKSNEMTSL